MKNIIKAEERSEMSDSLRPGLPKKPVVRRAGPREKLDGVSWISRALLSCTAAYTIIFIFNIADPFVFGGSLTVSTFRQVQAGTRWRRLRNLLSIARLPPGHDPGAGYGVATAARQRWHVAIRHFGLFCGPLAAAND